MTIFARYLEMVEHPLSFLALHSIFGTVGMALALGQLTCSM